VRCGGFFFAFRFSIPARGFWFFEAGRQRHANLAENLAKKLLTGRDRCGIVETKEVKLDESGKEKTMRLEKVRPGVYRSEDVGGAYVWVVREGSRRWWWFLGDKGIQEVWAESNGPFASPWKAAADAAARYQNLVDKKIIWWVHRPTYRGWLQPPHRWRLEPVVEGGEKDQMLSSGHMMNDAGEFHPLGGEWRRFTSWAEAEAWLSAEFDRYRR
jgi:hypothetical protein